MQRNKEIKKYKKITNIIVGVGILYFLLQLILVYKSNLPDKTFEIFFALCLIWVMVRWFIDVLQAKKVCIMIKNKKIYDIYPKGPCISFPQLNLKKYFKKFKIKDKEILLEIEIWNYKRLWFIILGIGQVIWIMFMMIFIEALKAFK